MRSFIGLLQVLHFIIVCLKITIRTSNYFYRNFKKNKFKCNFNSFFVVIHKYIQVLISKVYKFNNSVIHWLVYPICGSQMFISFYISHSWTRIVTIPLVAYITRYISTKIELLMTWPTSAAIIAMKLNPKASYPIATKISPLTIKRHSLATLIPHTNLIHARFRNCNSGAARSRPESI